MEIDTLDYYQDLEQAFYAGVNSAGEMHGDHGIAEDWAVFMKKKINRMYGEYQHHPMAKHMQGTIPSRRPMKADDGE